MTQESKEPAIAPVPSAGEFCFRRPLYSKLIVSEQNFHKIAQLLSTQLTFDNFCPFCGKDSTFKPTQTLTLRGYSGGFGVSNAQVWANIKSMYDPLATIKYTCTRVESHHVYFLLFLGGQEIEKIGQYPSMADFDKKRFKEFKGVLDDERLGELSRAVGLASHGVGVGSYVYLRRVFESLIEDVHSEARNGSDWDESKFPNRIDEKIQFLKSFLPKMLVENRQVYSILSKGIHELSEKECLDYFEVMVNGIELILREHLENKKRKEEEKKFRESVGKISGKIST